MAKQPCLSLGSGGIKFCGHKPIAVASLKNVPRYRSDRNGRFGTLVHYSYVSKLIGLHYKIQAIEQRRRIVTSFHNS
jgi:hypothetical protein